MHLFNNITLLITHYNRSQSLERLLQTLVNLKVTFSEIVVSDDGSRIEHLTELYKLKDIYQFNLVTTPTNKGLGNNINKGQDKVSKKYTLYIQEDFVPKKIFFDKLKVAYQFFQDDDELDFVRFYAYFKLPNLEPFKEGFSLVRFKPYNLWESYRKFYVYSDHPHLRKSNFFEKFGRYPEGIKPDKTEYKMMMKVLSVGVKTYFYEDFKALIEQENSEIEPSTVKRNFWRNNENILISMIRHTYRYLRFYIDLFILKLSNKN